jgi:hypothetical protein
MGPVRRARSRPCSRRFTASENIVAAHEKAVRVIDRLRDCALAKPRSWRRQRSKRPSPSPSSPAVCRDGKGRPRLARQPQELALIDSSTVACSIGLGLETRWRAATGVLRRDWSWHA